MRSFRFFEFKSTFDLSAQIHHLLKTCPPEWSQETYQADGVLWEVKLDETLVQSFQDELNQLSRGKISLVEVKS